MPRSHYKSVTLIIFIITVFIGTASADPTVEKMYRLMEEKKFKEAFDFAENKLDKYIGEPEFDFVYALTAMEVGKPDYAIYALQRILIIEASNDRVRAELARAHFLAEEYQQAKEQFEKILKNNPPENVRKNINLFMKSIELELKAKKIKGQLQASLSIGYDTNINSAVDIDNLDIISNAVETNVLLTQESRKQESAYQELNVGANITYPASQQVTFTFSLGATEKRHDDFEQFNIKNFEANSKIIFENATLIFTLPVSWSKALVYTDDGTDRMNYKLGFDLTHKFNPLNRFSLFSETGRSSYIQNDVQDTDSIMGGLSWARVYEHNVQSTISSYYVEEIPRNYDEGKEYGYGRVGVTASYQWLFKPKWISYFVASIQSTRYKDKSTLFQKTREDTMLNGALGILWNQNDYLNHNLAINYTDNNSNLPLFEYDKFLINYKITVNY